MRYEYFLARRYAFSKRRENFITIISIISIAGLTVGTAALIVVLSVFNGFSSVVTDVYVQFDPHVRISAASSDSFASDSLADSTNTTGPALITNTERILTAARREPEVLHAAPAIHGKAVLVHYTLPKVVDLTGISDTDARTVSGLAKSIQSGELKLDSDAVIVGQILADELALQLGDSLQIYSPTGLERILTDPIAPRMKRLIVRGIFAANNRDYDLTNAYVSAETARELFDLPSNAATTIDIRIKNVRDANDVRDRLKAALGPKYTVQSWYDLHTELYSVMEVERWVAYIILFLIVAVAAFNIFSSLTLTVFEKQRDIGLLRALGATIIGIRNIYFYEGMLIGALGTVLGCVLGLGVVLAQKQFGFFTLDSSVYIIPALPVELRWQDFVAVALGSFGLTAICSLLPSRRAAKVEPATALRWE
ncbi:MAG: ABC transporter permease [Bacteroidota bacterium]|nr:ABC transporter permease [Bacteroidota bacterium]MDP4233275.1 ABC transporter permease [Bacteroidota bacterium]MDP4242105.1 ABC transporter permease [Bacteroidota bacterium]MDP4288616.1 ABC transporter permease [Bacteroidota bacterium]